MAWRDKNICMRKVYMAEYGIVIGSIFPAFDTPTVPELVLAASLGVY